MPNQRYEQIAHAGSILSGSDQAQGRKGVWAQPPDALWVARCRLAHSFSVVEHCPIQAEMTRVAAKSPASQQTERLFAQRFGHSWHQFVELEPGRLRVGAELRA